MITYEQLYQLDVKAIKGAVDAWTKVIRRYDEWDEGYNEGVVKPFGQAGWTSVDGTSMFAQAQVASANKEFSDAVIEAKGIRAVLDDAYEELNQYKKDLHALKAEAKKDGVTISDTGKVTLDDPDKDGDKGRGPGGILPSENQEKMLIWAGRIELILVAATNADQSAAIALRRNTGKADDKGFNDKTVKSIDQDESQRAAKLLKKYEKGDKLTPGELKELERVMDHNESDPEFSRMVLNDLGPETTLRLAEDLAQEKGTDSTGKKYDSIQNALANNIATANKDKEFSQQWRKDMRALGAKQLDENDPNSPRGYQVLTGLLKEGHAASYPAHMTQGLTDDIIAAEKKNPNIWDETQRVRPGQDPVIGKLVDPVDDMLGMMSKSPETATDYLDPKGGNDRLKYLLDERDWKLYDVEERAHRSEYLVDRYGADPANSRVGLGSLLEAATVGDEAGPPHSEGQTRIMRDTVNLLDSKPGHEEIKPNLRQPLANALADYTNDTHEILRGHAGEYTTEVPGEKGSKEGADGLFNDKNGGAHMAVRDDSLMRVMRGVSEDPDAYGTLHKAEIAHISKELGAAEGDTADAIRTPASEGGAALGVYDAIREDTIYDKRDDENAKEDWKAKAIYHVGGTPITAVPIVGDAGQRILDAWTYDMSNQEKGYNNDAAAAEAADKNFKSRREMDFLINEWAKGEGKPGMDDPEVDRLQEHMANNRNTRHDDARNALGRE